MTTISLDHVKKQYPNGFTAIHDLSLDIQDQEFLVLVGPSGCGKTTLLRMIAGLEKISSGSLKMDGRVMNDVEAKDRDLAMVFQNYALYPHLTVFDNMAFSLKMRRVKKDIIKDKVEEAAEILGLADYLQRKPGELSGGQRQRVAMGRAIVRQPKAFLMDEPLSNLDAKLRVEMREEISRLYQRLKTTFIYVTHDQIEAMTLGTRVVVMDQGVIRQSGPPQELYEKPANLFVASFIGNHEMNFLRPDAASTSAPLLERGSQATCPLGQEDPITSAPPLESEDQAISSLGQEDPCTGTLPLESGQILGIRPEHLLLEKIDQAMGSGCDPLVVGNGNDPETVGPPLASEERTQAVGSSNHSLTMGTPLASEESTEAIDSANYPQTVGSALVSEESTQTVGSSNHPLAMHPSHSSEQSTQPVGIHPLMIGKIQFQEMLGDDDLIFVECGAQKLSVLTPHRTDLKPGDLVQISCSTAHIHYFDAQSGDALAK